MIPYKCPICEGKTLVKATFYKIKQNGYVACKACVNGIIWGYSYIQPIVPSPYIPYVQPDTTCGSATTYLRQYGLLGDQTNFDKYNITN
jgi:hypothetical protein